jgi:[ribosomal protein S18]-alanine N-acetyltransferase
MIRVGGFGDYSHMARIHSANFERGWSAEEIRELLDQPGAKAFIYDIEGSRAGFALVRFVADECEIIAIAVDAAYKRRGIGRKLLDHVNFYAHRDGIRTIHLEVAEDNLAAIALYTGAGYAENGRRKGYYRRWHGRRVDALMLARNTDA